MPLNTYSSSAWLYCAAVLGGSDMKRPLRPRAVRKRHRTPLGVRNLHTHMKLMLSSRLLRHLVQCRLHIVLALGLCVDAVQAGHSHKPSQAAPCCDPAWQEAQPDVMCVPQLRHALACEG